MIFLSQLFLRFSFFFRVLFPTLCFSHSSLLTFSPPLCPRSPLRTIVAQCHAAKRGVPPWSLPARVKTLRSVAIDGTTCMPREKKNKKQEMYQANNAIGLKNSPPFENNPSRHPPLCGQCQWSPLGNDGHLGAVRSICSRHFFAGRQPTRRRSRF